MLSSIILITQSNHGMNIKTRMIQSNSLLFDIKTSILRHLSGGNDTYGITGIPSMVGGRGVVQRAGLEASTKIVYPGSGREDA